MFFVYPFTTFICLVLHAHMWAAEAVQLSDIFNLPSYEYFPVDIRTFRDGTAVFIGSTSRPVSELSISPFVKVPIDPPRFGETMALARFYPENRTVIWAAAVVDIVNDVNIAVDPARNTYVIGTRNVISTNSSASPFILIKYGPRGNIIWKREYTDPSFGGTPAVAARTGYWLDDFSGRAIEFTRGRLVLSGIRPAIARRQDLLALVVRPGDGKLLAVRPLRAPEGPSPPEKLAFAANGGVACFAGKQELPNPDVDFNNATEEVSGRLFVDRMFVQCRRLAGGKAVTRMLKLAGRRLGSVEMGMIPGRRGRSPQVWVVYSSERDFEKVHEIAVYRMDAKTLNDIDWETGASKGSQGKGLVIDYSTPGRLGQAGTVFSVDFSSATDTLVVGYASTVKIRKVVQRGGRISIRGERSYSVPELTYMMFFGSSQRLTARLIADDPRRGKVNDNFNHLLVKAVTLSVDEKRAYLLGLLQRIRRGRFLAELGSGPFFTHPVSIPHSSEGCGLHC